MAVNHCLDHLRSRRARMARATESLDKEEAYEPAAVEPVVPTAISRIDLERAIAQLPDGCRTAFVLHDVEGLDHREVAETLGISEGTSKSQVHKARHAAARGCSAPACPDPQQRLRSWSEPYDM